MADSQGLSGIGRVRAGVRDLGTLAYSVERTTNGQATIVKFGSQPSASDGEKLHLTLENGLMLDCQVVDSSPYCAVVGEGPYRDRRVRRR